MAKQPNKQKRLNSLSLYLIVTVLFSAVGIGIIAKAAYTSLVNYEYWRTIGKRLEKENIPEPPRRGNIYSCNGELMATSMPYYTVFMDFMTSGLKSANGKNNYKDSLDKYIVPLSESLSAKFQDRSPKEYQAHILRGYDQQRRRYQLISRRVSHAEWKELCQFPFLSLGKNKSGRYNDTIMTRLKPYGSLASRTIGDVYGSSNTGSNGLELQYDSLLRGIPGKKTKRKIRNEWVNVIDVEPINGMDVTSTIDLVIQDITEKALLDKLKEIDAESGTAVVMEVETGEIKAITNLGRIQPGAYREVMNYAVADQSEPGSTFKVASMMVALEEGVIEPGDSIETGSGKYYYAPAKRSITDHRAGGFGRITAEQAIWYSSNIGVAKIILKGFEKNPARYVQKIKELGFCTPMDLEIQGAGKAIVKDPADKNIWWSSTLPWMSFGYETQIPPIYTLTFYNAIANNGRMVKPYFTKKITFEDKVVKTFGTEVINSSICSKSTLKKIHQMLADVVDKGTGQAVKSENVSIAGKTGTAQLPDGQGRYTGGHQVSFCGYFPADKPKYSCIVVIRRPRIGYPSGGTMSGGVFKSIAERTYAASVQIRPGQLPADSIHTKEPIVKGGSGKSTNNVLNKLNIDYKYTDGKAEWVKPYTEPGEVLLKPLEIIENLVPSVIGMGAREAVYLLEKSGMRVNLSGRGAVIYQSISPGTKVSKGKTITIRLS